MLFNYLISLSHRSCFLCMTFCIFFPVHCQPKRGSKNLNEDKKCMQLVFKKELCGFVHWGRSNFANIMCYIPWKYSFSCVDRMWQSCTELHSNRLRHLLHCGEEIYLKLRVIYHWCVRIIYITQKPIHHWVSRWLLLHCYRYSFCNIYN